MRKSTISWVMSVRQSAWNNSAPTGRIFMKSDVWAFFENLSWIFKFHYIRATMKGTVREDQYTFLSYLAHFFLEWEMFQTKVVDKIKTHIMYSVTFFYNSAVYEKMWKIFPSRRGHRRQYGACALHAGYLRLLTRTLRLCNTYCFCTATMVSRARLNVTLYVHCLSCSYFATSIF